MSRTALRCVLAVVTLTCVTAALASAQTTSQTKSFEVISVVGNDLVVKLPEGTKELTVPEDFRFTVDGQQLSVHDLKPGMKGTAVVTTKTTLVPVTVTEVKNGTVRQVNGPTIIVQTPEGFKMFTQSDVNKRGVKIIRDGKPAEISEFRAGDTLSATIVTSMPPKVITEKQVNASLARAAAGGAAGGSTKATGGSSASAVPSSSSASGAAGAPSAAGRSLPKTASPLPLVGLIGAVSFLVGAGLTARRRMAR
jgi:hypothetical protein